MKASNFHLVLAASALVVAATLASCGGGGDPVSSGSGTSGTLGVSLADAPACGFDHVNITVSKVRIHQSASAGQDDAGWIDLVPSSGKIDLLNLTNGVLQSLGEIPLAAGHYSQLRLVLDPNSGNALANSVTPAGLAEIALETPSALQSGIKLVNEFDVGAGQRVDLVLDFDACKSVVKRGNGAYALKPVIKVIPTALNGITGVVSPALLGKHPQVSAQQNGVIVSASTPHPTSGEFLLARLIPGVYDVVITADDRATAVVGAVPVANTTSTTVISRSTAPIVLLPSLSGAIGGRISLVPASLTEAAYASAKQTLPSGSTITVKYQGADLDTGVYGLTQLPLGAPLFASYTTLLPLVFAEQPSANPGILKYQVAASATGYPTLAIDELDISVVRSQTDVNFTLTR